MFRLHCSRLVGIGLLSVTLLTSCNPLLKNAKTNRLTTDYCKPQIGYDFGDNAPLTLISDSAHHILKQLLSSADYVLAQHTELLSPLASYISETDTLKKMLIRQAITNKVLLANTVISAVSAELDCNGERFGQLANFLGDNNSKNLRKATAASIAIGTAVGISTSFIDNDNTNIFVNIVGGAGSAGIGFLTLNPKGKRVALSFERSLIANIWNSQNADNAFPSFLWSILQARSFSNTGTTSLAENIKQRWLDYALDGTADESTVNLFFNKGGEFTAGDLQVLANMNNELQASIRSLSQDMLQLLLVIDKIDES